MGVFEQSVFHEIDTKMEKSEGKLLFFGQLKHKFGYENYLNMGNALNRKTITQMRLSAHKLEIEMGRYKNIDKRERMCQYCRAGEVESEYHFITKCPNYKEEREILYSHLTRHDIGYSNLRWPSILDIIFIKNDPRALNILGRFLRNCWEKRELMGSNLAH